MAKIGNRVKETSTTTGTGTLDLAGAPTGFRGFGDEFTSGDSVYYLCVDDVDNPTEYEYGIGTFTSGTPDTLSRDSVGGSSNAGAKVSWTAGCTVISTPTAASLNPLTRFLSTLSPAQITADQNDYSPTGLSGARVLRLSTDASRNITGLQGGEEAREITIENVGSSNVVLKDESASSTAANRFALTADVTIVPDAAVRLAYDGTASRWRLVGVQVVAGQLPATSTNDDAAAGRLGEYKESIVASGSAISLTTTVTANVTSISLTAGDWDVSGNVIGLADTTTVITALQAAISTTSATFDAPPAGGFTLWIGSVTGKAPGVAVVTNRLSLSATTTVYLLANGAFSTSFLKAYGKISARRVR